MLLSLQHPFSHSREENKYINKEKLESFLFLLAVFQLLTPIGTSQDCCRNESQELLRISLFSQCIMCPTRTEFIFCFSLSEIITLDAWEEIHSFEVSQVLISREERLFKEIAEQQSLTHFKEELDKLAYDYNDQKERVLKLVEGSLTLKPDDVKSLKSAIKAICEEEEQDHLWKHRDQTPPPWRPFGLKKLHDEKLCSLVKERLDNPPTPPAVQLESSIQADITSMGRQLKEDLLWVVDVLKIFYPSHMDICNFYARLYHQALSARLRKIADFGLGDKDCTFLLRWVNEYYPE